MIVDDKFFSFTTKSGIGNFFISYEYDLEKLKRTCRFITFVLQKLSANVLKIDVESYDVICTIANDLSEDEFLELNTIIIVHNFVVEIHWWLSLLKKCVNVVIVEKDDDYQLDYVAKIPAVRCYFLSSILHAEFSPELKTNMYYSCINQHFSGFQSRNDSIY